jgi:hypothetical protein
MDDKYIYRIVVVSIAAVVILACSFVGCTVHENACTLSAIKAGVSPLTAARAFTAGTDASDGAVIAEQLAQKK